MRRRYLAAACAVALLALPAAGVTPGLHSRTDASGTTTFWGDGASYEIAGPGVTVFFLQQRNGAVVAPMIRVAYVGDAWINVKSVSFTIGERTFGPYDDAYESPTRIEVGPALRVESLLFSIDSDERWRMLDAIAESDQLGRPVIAVLNADTPYGIEVDRRSKHATEQVVRGFRAASAR